MERGIVARRRGQQLGLALIAVVGGCTADSGGEGMQIVKNVRADTACMVSPSETEIFISEGVLDSGVVSGYLFIAQVKSEITALAGQEIQRTILMKDAKVDLTFPGSTLFTAAELADLRTRGVTHYKQLFSGPLAPNGGLTDIGFQLMPQAVVAELARKVNPAAVPMLAVVATFTIEGDMSGATVTSQPFTYPITLGKGMTARGLTRSCPLAAGTTVRPGYACNPVQDGIVDCCTDTATGQAMCPGPVAM